jgi:Sec-independent protein translocase protein TatA
MEILGVGPLEILFILLLAIIILGPSDMAKVGRTIGRFLRKLVTSPTYHTVQETSRNLRTIPTRLMREAGLEEEIKDLEQIRKDVDALRKPLNLAKGEFEKTIGEIRPPDAIPNDLSVWTTPPGNEIPPADAIPNDLSAWTTPPGRESRPSSSEPGNIQAESQGGEEMSEVTPQVETPESQEKTDDPPEAS